MNQLIYVIKAMDDRTKNQEQNRLIEENNLDLSIMINGNKITLDMYVLEKNRITWIPKAQWDNGEGVLIKGFNGNTKISFFENKKVREANIEIGKIYTINATIKNQTEYEIQLTRISEINEKTNNQD